MDPTGHFLISTLLISIGVGALFSAGTEFVSDVLDGNGFDHNWRDYVGAIVAGAIGGIAGGLGLNMLGSMICSAVGDSLGALIAGDIHSWADFGITVGLSIGTTVFSHSISSGVSKSFGSHKYKAFRGVSNDNTIVNKYLKGLKGSYKKLGINTLKIGANSMDDFLKKLSRTTSNVIVTEISGDFISGLCGVWF